MMSERYMFCQTRRSELNATERASAFIPVSLFSVSVSANTWATAIPTSCACHELWGNIQGEGLELRSLKRGPVWWRLRRSSAVQYALKWKEWPKAPWRGRPRGRAERGLACPRAASSQTGSMRHRGTESDHMSLMISCGRDGSNKIEDSKMRECVPPPTHKHKWQRTAICARGVQCSSTITAIGRMKQSGQIYEGSHRDYSACLERGLPD